jgi:hypothetical protein
VFLKFKIDGDFLMSKINIKINYERWGIGHGKLKMLSAVKEKLLKLA